MPNRRPGTLGKPAIASLLSVFLLLTILHPVPLVRAQLPDFSLTMSFRGEGLPQGSSDNYNTVNLTSLNGFSGNVNLTAVVSPALPNGPVVSFSIPTVGVPADGNGYSQLVVSTTTGTPVENYTATIAATSVSLVHTTIVWIMVSTPYQPPDFSISANPSVVTVQLIPHLAVDLNTTLTLTSLNGLEGNISLTFSTLPGPAVIITPSTVSLDPGGTAAATLTLQPYYSGNYSVLVIASPFGYPGHDTTVTFNVIPPPSDIPLLDYHLSYYPKPIPGENLTVTNTFRNQGPALIRIDALTLGLFGSFSPTHGLPFNLTSGERRVFVVAIQIPSAAQLGNQTLTVTVEWSYYASSQGLWFQGARINKSGNMTVAQSVTTSTGNSAARLTKFLMMVGPWILLPYLLFAGTGVIMVIRRDKRKQEELRNRQPAP